MVNRFFSNCFFLISILTIPILANAATFMWHDKGEWAPIQASQIDPRFQYMVYAPSSYKETGEKEYTLLVLVHGTERGPWRYIQNNTQFADENDLILLAPLFPANTHGGKDLENYKLINYKDTRYDLVLLSMIDEISSKYRIKDNQFHMFGFSGGGHFAHRFYYLHPHRLKSVSIGAPGMITLIDDSADWWVGTKNLYHQFNSHLNVNAMKKVPIHMVIGEKDVEKWEQKIEEGSPYRMNNEGRANYHWGGENRQDKLKSLKENYESMGITVELETVPNAGHEVDKLFPALQDFLRQHL